jgi:signal recognition particle subunit SRP54
MASALTEKLWSRDARPGPHHRSNVQDMLREVRMALLEADVALPVVRDFIARVKEKALGQEVLGSLNPGQALVGIVHKELAATMGEGVADINLAAQPPAVILMAGLQGAGKTTTTAKLAKHLIEKRKKKVLTVSGDVYRPAAIEQLKTVTAAGRRRVVPVHARPEAARHRAGRAGPRQDATTSTCCWSTPPAAWPSTRR